MSELGNRETKKKNITGDGVSLRLAILLAALLVNHDV